MKSSYRHFHHVNDADIINTSLSPHAGLYQLRQLHRLPIQKWICHKILPLTGQFMITPPSTSLISKNTTLLAFSDQHLDLDVPGLDQGFQDKAVWLASLQIRRSLPLKCPPWEHQGEGLHSVFQIFAENLFLYLGMIVNAIVYVRLRWCVCVKCSWCCHNYSVRVCVCVILFSVIIICISVYIFTFNCYV